MSTITFILQSSLENDDDEILSGSILKALDDCTILYFTLEYLVRFICSPKKWKFFKHPMNIIDLLAILPFYLTFIIDQLEDLKIIARAGKTVRLVRVLRIIRIFKLVRHFAGLQSLIHTLSEAYKELGLLMLIVSLSILTFAVLIFYAERDNTNEETGRKKMSTIFKRHSDTDWTFIDCLWWCIMTMTTVGSNHQYPSTKLGQLVGAICTIAGVFILSLPIPIVVNSFSTAYKNQMWRNEVAYNKAEQLQIAKRGLTRDMETKILGLPRKKREESFIFRKTMRRKRPSFV